MSLFAELKRRNVIRMAGLYLVAAWLITQVSSTVLPMFDAPGWLPRSIVTVLAIGFIPALVFAWVFELTPAGLKRDADVPVAESIAPSTGRRMDRIIIVVLAVALAYFGFDKFAMSPHRAAARPDSAAPAAEQDVVPPSAIAATPAAARSALVSDQSIAVLPFENLSADKENAFFADGIQDEILTGLAKIGGLKVISRTSTLRYSSRPPNLSEIARELGVANILEGSVQKAGNRVRVNVQLIDARSDSHLWAETYDRDLKDVFAVQSEIAEKIATSLQTTLTTAERASINVRPTSNLEAYENYLRGRSLILRTSSYNRASVSASIDALEAAVALDPGFALAWQELSQQHVWAYFTGFDAKGLHLARAKVALERAETLDPESPQVGLARANYLYYAARDFAGALAVVRKSQRGLPNDARAWYLSALLGRRLGQWDSSNADFSHARELNPNDYSVTSEFALSLFAQRRYDEAMPLIDAAMVMQPDDPLLITLKTYGTWNLDGLEAGGKLLAAVNSDSPGILSLRATQAWYERDPVRAMEALRLAIRSDVDRIILPNSIAGYIPAQLEWQLLLASMEARSNPAGAAERYKGLLAEADLALSRKPASPYIEAAWRVVRGWALSGLGKHEAAASEGRRAVASIPAANDAMEGPIWVDYLARIYAMNGDAAEARPLIARQLQTKGSLITVRMLQIDPVWDRLRSDPGFKALAVPPARDAAVRNTR